MIIYPACWKTEKTDQADDSRSSTQALAALLAYVAEDLRMADHQEACRLVLAAREALRRP